MKKINGLKITFGYKNLKHTVEDRCPKCNIRLSRMDRFCRMCGRKLTRA